MTCERCGWSEPLACSILHVVVNDVRELARLALCGSCLLEVEHSLEEALAPLPARGGGRALATTSPTAARGAGPGTR
jgi:hypothetical protein